MYDHLMQTAELSLGWDFYGPLLGMVVFILLGVRIWAVVGLGSVVMLMTTEVLPAPGTEKLQLFWAKAKW